MKLTLAPGADWHFVFEQPFGVDVTVWMKDPDPSMVISADSSTISLNRFEPKRDAHVRGTLSVAVDGARPIHGKGEFDAVLCEDVPPPPDVKVGEVVGWTDKKSFVGSAAFVLVDAREHVREIDFYPMPVPDCASRDKIDIYKATYLQIDQVGLDPSKPPADLRVRQPIRAMSFEDGGFDVSRGWLALEAERLDGLAHVKGSFVVSASASSFGSGKFDAIVCRP